MPGKTVSICEFAKLVGVSPGAVRRRVLAGLLPRSARHDGSPAPGGRGRWRIDPVAGREEWLAAIRLTCRAAAAEDGAARAWQAARTRREAARAALAELQVAQHRGQLVDVARVEAGWAGLVAAARTRVLAVPSRLRQRCPHLPPADVAAVDDLVREALEELAGGGGGA